MVWGFNTLNGGTISLGTLFLFIQLSQMLFRPLRQIADKFNTLQMGMVAAKGFLISSQPIAKFTNGNVQLK